MPAKPDGRLEAIPTKIGIQIWGSEGDIRPFIALTGGLLTGGHDVTLEVMSAERVIGVRYLEPE